MASEPATAAVPDIPSPSTKDDWSRPLESVQEETDPSTFVEEEEENDGEEVVEKDQEPKGDDVDADNVDDDGKGDSTEDEQHGLVAMEEDDMPLLKYRRLAGNLPREAAAPSTSGGNEDAAQRKVGVLKVPCTCTALGRVVLPPEVNAVGPAGGALPNPSSVVAVSPTTGKDKKTKKNSNDPRLDHPFFVMAVGFQNGLIMFVDMETGASIVPPKQLKEGLGNTKDEVVDVSIDSSGGYLAAINAKGSCTVWEIRYTRSKQEQEENVFTNFLTSLAGQEQQQQQQRTSASQRNLSESTTILQTLSVQPSKTNYPSSFGCPSCMVIDPSYKRRREKALIVGFKDGRLLLTKKGFFNRRTDSIVYQSAKGPESLGIEALAWRGPLVAWADYTGIKLFDVETMMRIAHVDRPSGARVSLYPTVSSLKPSLCFETSHDVLVAWGDCVMTLHIKETVVKRTGATSGEGALSGLTATSGSATADFQSVMKRRQVECSMAWELDCIACDVVSLDKDRLIVMGLVPNDEEDNDCDSDDDVDNNNNEDQDGPNDLEIQVISRAEGTVMYADIIPVLRLPSQYTNKEGRGQQESASNYSLLSSFALPRMEDTIEAEEEGAASTEQDFDFSLFGSTTKYTFEDSHLKWNLSSVVYDVAADPGQIKSQENGQVSDDDDDAEDTKSVDSDDYEFILRPSNTKYEDTIDLTAVPPIMSVIAPSDVVGVRTSDADDAVEHALTLNRVALALERGLRHKRKLRAQNLDDLVDHYLKAVLHINDKEQEQPQETEETNNTEEEKEDEQAARRALSIRRLKLGAAATPKLLGGNTKLWKRWLREFTKIPGALFIVGEQLPVRDPKLPQDLYQDVLLTMLKEVEEMEMNSDTEAEANHLFEEARKRYVYALYEWGTTHALRESITFHKTKMQQHQQRDALESPSPYLEDVEKALQRRLTQSAVGYLELMSDEQKQDIAQLPEAALMVDSVSDSLFHLDDLLTIVNEGEKESTRTRLETLGILHMMATNYVRSLRCFLSIAHSHSDVSIDAIEKQALGATLGGNNVDSLADDGYGFVLGMIEHHRLHHCLRDAEFLDEVQGSEGSESPLIAFIRLVGLEAVGNFLLEHCVQPSKDGIVTASDGTEASVMPLDVVADQFTNHRPLLYWYLEMVFEKKPDAYVTFPDTAVPPKAVTDLHRVHLDLHVEFAKDKSSAKLLAGTEAYNLERKTTPLLSFLKSALPLGGVRPTEVRQILESQRSEGDKSSFALELAFVIEEYGEGSEEDADTILDLYLTGAESVMLAASCAQRTQSHSTRLWNNLIQSCLDEGKSKDGDGSLFGSLLESAALCGADLSLLVSRIPEGMNVEGLRPKLVAAVGDYRLKLKMHEASSTIAERERVSLLCELGHRSRRGTRFFTEAYSLNEEQLSPCLNKENDEKEAAPHRPRNRPTRYRWKVGVAMR